MSRDILNSLSFEMHYDDFSGNYYAYIYDTVTRSIMENCGYPKRLGVITFAGLASYMHG